MSTSLQQGGRGRNPPKTPSHKESGLGQITQEQTLAFKTISEACLEEHLLFGFGSLNINTGLNCFGSLDPATAQGIEHGLGAIIERELPQDR